MQTLFARGAAALLDKEKPELVGRGEVVKRERERMEKRIRDKGRSVGRLPSSNLSKWDLVVSFLAASSLHPRCCTCIEGRKEGRKRGVGQKGRQDRWVKSNEGWVAI